jgi:hypothetical protein
LPSYQFDTYNLSLVANKVADANNLLLGEVVHLPVILGTADLDGEVGKDVRATLGVRDLGVELDAYHSYLLVDYTTRRVVGASIPKMGSDL